MNKKMKESLQRVAFKIGFFLYRLGMVKAPDPAEHKGNQPQYRPEQGAVDENSPLKGKQIIFLGSSVTFGAASLENAFVEYLEHWDGVIPVKEAVSGTLLVDEPSLDGKASYIARMKTIDPSLTPAAFLCQLSTNDASMKRPLGEVSRDGNFDTHTVTGAIEYIIDYARKTWNCPVAFYTGSKYNSPDYAAMVARLLELKEKWGIGVIDLWNDEQMNAVSEEDYKLYMSDPIHPTMAGYSRWWYPKIRQGLTELLKED